ncbi:hypothetical protein BGP77_12365 [Saccharospirillum sp. MSK14-1]|nr:hypothetical protein BGP77_12365 [Saccharospirillum sp. MSK14-1]
MLLVTAAIGGCDSTSSAMPPVQTTALADTDRIVPPAPDVQTTVGDAFGTAIAISADGNTLAVSAPGEDSDARGFNGDEFNNKALNSGAVYLYHKADGRWIRQGFLKAKDSQLEDRFGSGLSLSADGSVLAVGASQTDELDDVAAYGKGVNQGSVYLYRRKQQHWHFETQLKASNADSFDGFGSVLTLSADGRTLAVTAPGEDSTRDAMPDDNTGHNTGAVYLFGWHRNGWQQQALLKAPTTESMENFGQALSLSAHGKMLAIGASQHDGSVTVDGKPKRLHNTGVVYLFQHHQGQWQPQSQLTAHYSDERDNFGNAVSLSADGTHLAVSAQGEAGLPGAIQGGQDNSATNAGAVYLFDFIAGQWQQQAYLKADNGEQNDGFGSQLQLSADGKSLAVSAQWEDSAGGKHDNSALQAGAVYVFDRRETHWKQTAYLKASAPMAKDQFGNALSLSANGRTLVVGVAAEDAGLNENGKDYHPSMALGSGAVYSFSKSADQWQLNNYFKSNMGSGISHPPIAANH